MMQRTSEIFGRPQTLIIIFSQYAYDHTIMQLAKIKKFSLLK